jgi:hypothetical protein
LIKGFPRTRTTTTRTTTTTKQNVDPAVYYVYSRVKIKNLGSLDQAVLLAVSKTRLKISTETLNDGHRIYSIFIAFFKMHNFTTNFVVGEALSTKVTRV